MSKRERLLKNPVAKTIYLEKSEAASYAREARRQESSFCAWARKALREKFAQKNNSR